MSRSGIRESLIFAPKSTWGVILKRQHDLGGTAFIHGLVCFGCFLQRKGEAKDCARVDLVSHDELNELRQKAAYRCRTAKQVYGGNEEISAIEFHAVGDTDEAHVPARTGGTDCLLHRFLGAHCLNRGMRTVAVG